VELFGVVAVPAARVVEHVPLLEPARADHARNDAVGEPLRPREVVIFHARLRQRRLPLERDARADCVECHAQRRGSLLHRVEEDAIHVEQAHDFGDRVCVVDAFTSRADIPRVVVDEDAHAAGAQRLDERR